MGLTALTHSSFLPRCVPSLRALLLLAQPKSGRAGEKRRALLLRTGIEQVNAAQTPQALHLSMEINLPAMPAQRIALSQGLPGLLLSLPTPQPLPNVHLSNLYVQIAADKYLMYMASEER